MHSYLEHSWLLEQTRRRAPSPSSQERHFSLFFSTLEKSSPACLPFYLEYCRIETADTLRSISQLGQQRRKYFVNGGSRSASSYLSPKPGIVRDNNLREGRDRARLLLRKQNEHLFHKSLFGFSASAISPSKLFFFFLVIATASPVVERFAKPY